MKIKVQSQHKLKNNLRWDMLVLLDQIENQGQYSNYAVDHYLETSTRSDKDKNLVVKVVYGCLQHRLTLDFYLQPFIKGKLEDWVQQLLRLSIYQAVYLDRIPQHAIVNEAVEIAKINGHAGLGKLVNAILRYFYRQPLASFDTIEDPLERLSIQFSLPVWLIKYFSQRLGEPQLSTFFESLNQPPHLSLRVNPIKGQRLSIQARLEEEGILTCPSELSSDGLRVISGNALKSTSFQDGYVTVQDESSMLVAPLGKLEGHEQVLDACAAPGGKATHIASLLTSGHLTALDLSAKKLKRLIDHAHRMDLSNKMTSYATDALDFSLDSKKSFDVIYLDAPCLGLGLMRRKPEIRYQKSVSDLQKLVDLQSQLFNHLLTLVKPGGRLIYSTCSLTWEENEDLVEKMVKQHPELSIDPIQESEGIPSSVLTPQGFVRIWPHQFESDGFFISRFCKN